MISELLKVLFDAEVPHDVIIRAVQAVEEMNTMPQKSKAAIRQERYRERNKPSQNVTRNDCDGGIPSPPIPPDGFPDLSLTPLKSPPIHERAPAKPSLEELTVDHIAEWLSRKRAEGKYRDVDEHQRLEDLKDYCRSKGVKYKDYEAAFRNFIKATHPRQPPGPQRTGGFVDPFAEIIAGHTSWPDPPHG